MRYRDAEGNSRRKAFANRKEAETFQEAVRTDVRRGDYVDPKLGATPFREVAEAWFAGLDPDLKPKTRAGYRQILDRHLLPAFGNTGVARIRPSDVRGLLAGLEERSTSTRRNVLRVMSMVMSLALEDGMVRANPCIAAAKRLRTSNGHNQEEMRFLTAQQVQELVEEISPAYRTLILFAAYTGMRAGECVALRVRNLDLLHRVVHVRESVSDVAGTLHVGTTKNRRHRTVALPAFLADLLAPEVAGKDPDDRVFAGANGGILRHGNFYARHFRPAVQRLVTRGEWPADLAGLRFHDLRHTCASLLVSAGVNIVAVSRQLGHSSIAITADRYTHLFKEDQEEVAKAMDATWRKSEAVEARQEAEVKALGESTPYGSSREPVTFRASRPVCRVTPADAPGTPGLAWRRRPDRTRGRSRARTGTWTP